VFRRRSSIALTLAVTTSVTLACGKPRIRSTLNRPPTPAEMAQLWIKPDDIASRDLFWGMGGERWAPKPGTRFKVTAFKETGWSPGWDVQDPDTGREYDVKVGPEAQVEVVLSRLMWGVGYHQPPVYLLTKYDLSGEKATEMPMTGRFRPKLKEYDNIGDWSWHENPFVGTRELKGLIVLQLIFNNWDMKPPQNKIYEVRNAGDGPARWYVVRDLGAALGKTGWPTGTKNNPDDYEQQPLINRVHPDGRLDFEYKSRHGELLRDIRTADVGWICELMNQLTPKQYADAFRAGAYPDDVAARFIAKMQAKVQEGLNLRSPR
jgi:hypothetical protein